MGRPFSCCTKENTCSPRLWKSWFKSAHCGIADLMALLMGICILLFICIIFSFLLGYFFAMQQITDQDDFVYYYTWQKQLDRSDPNEADIMETREYQLRLPTDVYINRLEAVNELTRYLREISGEKLDPNDAKIEIFKETQLSSGNCGIKFSELRLRHFYDENGNIINKDITTLDINHDAEPPELKEAALKWNLTANAIYKNEQKLEQGKKAKSFSKNFCLTFFKNI